jgi:hypothetical protein
MNEDDKVVLVDWLWFLTALQRPRPGLLPARQRSTTGGCPRGCSWPRWARAGMSAAGREGRGNNRPCPLLRRFSLLREPALPT